MNCRFGSKRSTPYDIPPNSESKIDCDLAVGVAGPYSGQLHFFVDDGGVREIVVFIAGTAAAVPGLPVTVQIP